MIVSIVLLLCLMQIVQGGMPTVTLPWGTYSASLYDAQRDMYTFTDVRFGKAPVGSLRFMQSEYPQNVTNPADVFPMESGARCTQVQFKNCPGYSPPECVPQPLPGKPQGEDCLFLDMYVPGAAIRDRSAKLPVVVWLYGGAYIIGSKDAISDGPYNAPFYNGSAFITKQQSFIFVAGNYRLGAYGWLAGDTMQSQGYPNAGLSDQRLLFSFVHDFIDLVGGDAGQITAWGESAGAGSIIDHLISEPAPQFQKAALQSPAFELNWDPKTMENTYQLFAQVAGLPNAEVADLQKLDAGILAQANDQLTCQTTAVTGLFPLGPAVDGSVIKDLPPVAFENGRFNKLDSILVSHVEDEAAAFIPPALKPKNNPTEATFNAFLKLYFPEDNLEGLIDNVTSQYPSSKFNGNQTLRVKEVIRDSIFTCNTRYLYDAYKGKAYMMQYSLGSDFHFALHATDLPALFWNSNWKVADFLSNVSSCVPKIVTKAIAALWATRAPVYQSYFSSFARCGDPSKCPTKSLVKKWPLASLDKSGKRVTNVLDFGGVANFLITDEQNTWDICEFWKNAAQTLQDSVAKQYDGPSRTEQLVMNDL